MGGVPQGSVVNPLQFFLHFNDSLKLKYNETVLPLAGGTVFFAEERNLAAKNKISEALFHVH